MKRIVMAVERFFVSDDGPTAVEYAVLLALIVIVCITAIRTVGTSTANSFANSASQIGS